MARNQRLGRQLLPLAPLALALLAFLLAPAPPLRAAPTLARGGPGVAPAAADGGILAPAGHGPRGLRLALVVALGLALACGAAAQYRSIAGDRGGATPVARLAMTHRGFRPPAWRGVAFASEHGGSAERAGDAETQGCPGAAPRRPGAPREDCARAVAAAFVYDRAGTVAAFVAALAADPDLQPAATPGYWEMPSTGHADLARAYLQLGRPLDARPVLTVALLSFEHNRELETLLRETAPSWEG